MAHTKHSFENKYRPPYEIIVALISIGFGYIIVTEHGLVALTPIAAATVSVPFFILGIWRSWQAWQLMRFHWQLLVIKPFRVGTEAAPCSKKTLYLGQGFRFHAIHRHRLSLLAQSQYARYRRYPWYRPKHKLSVQIGGAPWLHGIGMAEEQAVTLPQANRNSHMVVFGMTRVGKTRFMSNLINQDIRNGEVVIVIDPKGDLDLLMAMYRACKVAGRLSDFIAVHAGFPDDSACYNPLSAYSDASDVTTRVTNAISAEGEGKQFKDFAWKFLNIVVKCLEDMDESIDYQSLSFFIMRPKQLLLRWCETMLPKTDAKYKEAIEKIIAEGTQLDKRGQVKVALTRLEAIMIYVKQHIEHQVTTGNYQVLYQTILADLFEASQMSEEYYRKITASLGPVFDKINKTSAATIFSFKPQTTRPVVTGQGLPILTLENAIANRQVVYIGLDALTNKERADAVGQAIIADLVSLCGRRYKRTKAGENLNRVCLHADEFSEIVRDDFITLLNKAGGAGVQVCAYTQTLSDLGAAFAGNPDKPQMLLGNFGTLVALRIAPSAMGTATVLTACVEKTIVRSTTPSTMSQDRGAATDGELFSTQNTDTVREEQTELIQPADLCALPKGQAFVITDGGQLYKIRIPLPQGEEAVPSTFRTLLQTINRQPHTVIKNTEKNIANPTSITETTNHA